MNKPFRIRLPFGTLKIATYLQLNSAEHDGTVPLRRLGRYYVIWKPLSVGGTGRAGGRQGPR